jgi:nucleoid-associated protein YgaU
VKIALGGLELSDFEKPSSVPLGGKQNLIVKEFPGGNVSIQNFGPTYRPISWSGTFIGSDAYDRMMKIGLMRTAGKPVELSSEKFSMLVMIEEFLPDYKTNTRIPFSITLRRMIEPPPSNTSTSNSVDSVFKQVEENLPTDSGGTRTYVVQEGDTLTKIASKELSSPDDWEQIYEDNQSVLVDGPHLITPGMELKLRA